MIKRTHLSFDLKDPVSSSPKPWTEPVASGGTRLRKPGVRGGHQWPLIGGAERHCSTLPFTLSRSLARSLSLSRACVRACARALPPSLPPSSVQGGTACWRRCLEARCSWRALLLGRYWMCSFYMIRYDTISRMLSYRRPTASFLLEYIWEHIYKRTHSNGRCCSPGVECVLAIFYIIYPFECVLSITCDASSLYRICSFCIHVFE